MSSPGPRLAPVLAIFTLSGAAGLTYEVVWSRQLVLVFGNTTQAVSTILTGFFAGMALGSLVGGRLADRVRSPLRLYAALELVLVAVVLATPVSFRLIADVYRGGYPSLEDHAAGLALIRFALAVVALAPATVLMGATLPALTRHLTSGEHLSAAFGRLYSVNTYGAVVGTLVSGLVLIEWLGLTRTLAVGAACSGLGGLIALVLSRGQAPAVPVVAAREATAGGRPRVALLLAGASGLTSLGYQVLWTRLLSSGTGNNTYVFTLILATFLLGIALGAQVFNVARPRAAGSVGTLAAVQALIAVLALTGLAGVISHPTQVQLGEAPIPAGAIFPTVLVVVLPTAIALGFMLPAAATLLPEGGAGRQAGRLLAANTSGAIVGTFVLPFLAVPVLGAVHALELVAGLNVLTAAVLTAGTTFTWRTVVPVGIAAATLAVTTIVPGAVRDPGVAGILAQGGSITDSREDRIASVQAGTLDGENRLWVAGTSMTTQTVDAKLMPLLPLMLRPGSDHVLTVAFGMGSAFRSSLIAGMQTTSAELVPSVPKMFGHFYDDAGSVIADPRGRIVVTDGRNFLELTRQRFDIIVTDPPPPITSAGASVISSLEYYEAGHRRLSPGGIMMQWLPFGSDLAETKAHLRTFRRVFPHMAVMFSTADYGLYLLGSDAPLILSSDGITAALSRPGVLEEINSAYDAHPTDLQGWARRIEHNAWISDAEVDAFTGSGPVITDDRPYAEYFWLRHAGASFYEVRSLDLRKLAP